MSLEGLHLPESLAAVLAFPLLLGFVRCDMSLQSGRGCERLGALPLSTIQSYDICTYMLRRGVDILHVRSQVLRLVEFLVASFLGADVRFLSCMRVLVRLKFDGSIECFPASSVLTNVDLWPPMGFG